MRRVAEIKYAPVSDRKSSRRYVRAFVPTVPFAYDEIGEEPIGVASTFALPQANSPPSEIIRYE
jgi:hypothetical protein